MNHRITAAIIAASFCMVGPSDDGARHRDTVANHAVRIQKPLPPSATYAKAELTCLARAMWFEAGNQPRRGQVAVGEVVLERTHDPRFPGKPCQVVAQRNQFSFVHHGVIPRIPLASDAQAMEALARRVIDGAERSGLAHALFFHARYVHPDWHYVQVGMIGAHIFYRDRSPLRGA